MMRNKYILIPILLIAQLYLTGENIALYLKQSKQEKTKLVNSEEIATELASTSTTNTGSPSQMEAPEGNANLSTSIDGLMEADPSSGIILMAAPTANHLGTANTSFPLKLPQGRQGMQPDLQISYNSEATSSWLGLGWDLILPTVEIDTRWGVPRFEADTESETYLLEGQQLWPVAHRNVSYPREAERRFYPRVEQAFSRIIRHGDQPSNYWWEVSETNGVQKFYGGRPGEGIIESAILRDGNGNISRWALTEMRDKDSNFVRYHCQRVTDPGLAASAAAGYQLYLDRVTYTGHQGEEGPFEVDFIRDRELGESLRKDIRISARLGFKEVTADLLRRVEVTKDGNLIRHYELSYTEGAFFKTLLSGLAEYDSNGDLFYSHSFEYYDEVRQDGSYQPYGPAENWTVADDNVGVNFINPLPLFPEDVSMLGGSSSSSIGGGSAVTFGPIGPLASKEFTAGGNFFINSTNTEGLIAFVDINGDGLPDKVFRQGDNLYYRANDGVGSFGERRPVIGISHFSTSKSNSTSIGFEANVTPVFVGYDNTTERSTTDTYFSDFNGDELIDIAFKGRVYFCHINSDGDPVYTLSSGDTPSPIQDGSPVDGGIIVVDPEEQEELVDMNPLHDVVRCWEAPCTGTIRIDAPVQLIQDNSPAAQSYDRADGVRVAIQLGQIELWSSDIAGDDFAVKNPVGLNNINITKGSKLYFRVQSKFDGAYDQVDWDPVISYVGEDATEIDANGKTVYRFQASEDFLLASCQSTSMPINGTLQVDGQFQKPITTDDLTLIVWLDRGLPLNIPLYTATFPWDSIVDMSIQVEDVPVLESDDLMFQIISDSNIDWGAISWTPQIYFSEAADGSAVIGANGEYLYAFCPAVDYQMYNEYWQKSSTWIAPDSLDMQVGLPANFANDGNLPDGEVTLVAKGLDQLYAKVSFNIDNGDLPTLTPFNLTVAEGDSVYFAYYASNYDLGQALGGLNVLLMINDNPVEEAAGLFSKRIMDEMIFGPQYRGWGQFAYNGNRERAQAPINELLLALPDVEIDSSELEDIENIEDLDGLGDPTQDIFVLMYSDPKTKSWRGYDDLTYLQGDLISSSRMGEDDILLSPSSGGGGSGASAPNLISISKINSIAGGLSAGPGSLGASQAWNETENILDVMDFNGDRYPDVVSPDKIQYTSQRGGLEATAVPHNLGSHEAHSEATGVTLGGTFVHSSPSNSSNSAGKGSRKKSRRTKATVKNSGNKSRSATKSARGGAGLSGNYTDDNDETIHSWLDINGDGLTDKVFRGGDVALNYGYRFGPREDWGFGDIRKGKSTDIGGGFGFNYANNSIAAGVSLSRTDNFSSSGLQDVNGDGLLDIIRYEEPNVFVRLHRGNGFGPEIAWPGADILDEGDATAESANVAFTICIPVFFVRFCVNPSTAIGQGVSRVLTQINDLDGDGFPDQLSSDQDGKLRVKTSTIGRTNLLKLVNRPLGGSFSLDYALSGNDYGLPYGKWTLSEVTLNDGLSGDGANQMKTHISYEEGLYERHEREFYGFGKVTSDALDTENNDALYRRFVTTYDVSNYYQKGLVLSESLLDADGNKFTETTHSYSLKDIETGADLAPILAQSADGKAFPAKVNSIDRYFEGETTAGLQKQMTYSYDLYGNIISSTDFGDGSPEDQKISLFSYHDLEIPYIKTVIASEEISDANNLLRKRETTINDEGDIIQIRRYLADGTIALVDLEHNEFGNVISELNAANSQGQRLGFTYRYDEELNTYLEETEDGYGYTSRQKYDPIYGQLLEVTDINGQSRRMTLDIRGRLDTITGPYELDSGQDYTIYFSYHSDAPVPYATSHHYDPEHEEDIVKSTFIDGLARPVQTKSTAAIFTNEGQDNQLQLSVSGRTDYDAFGRVIRQYYPSLAATTSLNSYSNQTDNISPNRYSYDVLDRPTQIELPDGANTTIAYSIENDNTGYPSQKSHLVDALGQVRDRYMDVRGRTRANSDLGPAGEQWTHFRYNAINEHLETIDHEGNSTIYGYDMLGRNIEVNHPDGGSTRYIYDLADNLIRKTTANIRDQIDVEAAIIYTYDFERLIQIDYPKQIQNRVQLYYGEVDAPYNRAGRVWLREDASGGEEYFFGPQGEVTKCIRTLLINEANVRTFVTESSFDTWHRIQQLIYPDGEQVNYHYNRAGQFAGMDGEKQGRSYTYVEQVGYDKFGQKIFQAHGNGTETRYDYEPERRRLSTIQLKGAGANLLMDYQISYDAVDNVKSIQNNAAAATIGGPTNHNYVYDELNRLIEATGSWQGTNGVQDYTLFLEYDQLNNLKRKTQNLRRDGQDWTERSFDISYEYDNNRPHVATTVGGSRYEYDANGNQLGFLGERGSYRYKQLIWDEENRLMGVSDNGYISQFTYDARDQRTIKSHGGLQGVFVDGAPSGRIDHRQNYTAYVSPLFSATELSFTKHYFADGQRILSKQGTGVFNNKYWFGQGITAGGLNFTQRLQMMQTRLAEYYEELGIPPGPPTLGGIYAQPEYTGSPLPGGPNTGYQSPPRGWPGPIGPPDTTRAPGPPTWYGEAPTRENVRAGYGFEGNGVFPEIIQFYYHHDHLGNNSHLTDYNGNLRQHNFYLPSGEIFSQELTEEQNQPYTFNDKEWDQESGLYYYHARYYDPVSSLWQSIDPLAHLYPAWSPYNYALQNPSSLIDPDGRKPGKLYQSPNDAAKAFGRYINPTSIAQHLEYAANIYEVKKRGRTYYAYSKPAKGTIDGSDPSQSKVPRGHRVVADIHTHGAEDSGYDNNNFSPNDFVGIFSDFNKAKQKGFRKYRGYVVTPNGQLRMYDPATSSDLLISTSMPHDVAFHGPVNPAIKKRLQRQQQALMRRGNSHKRSMKKDYRKTTIRP